MKYNPCSKEFQEKAKELGLTGRQYFQKLLERKIYTIEDMQYNPCSEEFQEKARELGLTGHQYLQKLVEEGKLRNPTDIDRESNNTIYKKIGYEGSAHFLREWRHDNGVQSPMEENKACAHYLGTVVAERQYARIILPEIFGGIEREMPYGNPKYDFIAKNGIKVDVKSRCIREYPGWRGWEPHIRFNETTDYFLILAFDNRENLNLIHVWLIGGNEIIRGHKFYMRDSIKITDKSKSLLEFQTYELTNKLECLKK